MPVPVAIVPFAEGAPEAARLVDADAVPIASIRASADSVELGVFRDAVVSAALEVDGGVVAGVLFASRWGGGGVLLT